MGVATSSGPRGVGPGSRQAEARIRRRRALWRNEEGTGEIPVRFDQGFGAALLSQALDIKKEDIEACFIAGGFGRRLNIDNAVNIGLFPDIQRKKFKYLGNTSIMGAHLILTSEDNRDLVDHISKYITYIELNSEPGYMNEYTGALFLPHTDLDLFPSVRSKLSN